MCDNSLFIRINLICKKHNIFGLRSFYTMYIKYFIVAMNQLLHYKSYMYINNTVKSFIYTIHTRIMYI